MFLHLLHAKRGKIYFMREVFDVYARHSEGIGIQKIWSDFFDVKKGLYLMNLFNWCNQNYR